MGTAFQFDPAGHVYTVDGVRVPSVTQILEGVGISDFGMVPREQLAYAQELGTAVHAATEAHDQDDLDFASVAGTVVEPYLQAWIAFRKETGFAPRLIEHRGVAGAGGQRYGFCVDREGEWGDGSPAARGLWPTVLDIKTGAPSRSWAIQLAAYEHALYLRDGQRRRRAVVHLHADCSFTQILFTDHHDESVWGWALGIETWKRLNA